MFCVAPDMAEQMIPAGGLAGGCLRMYLNSLPYNAEAPYLIPPYRHCAKTMDDLGVEGAGELFSDRCKMPISKARQCAGCPRIQHEELNQWAHCWCR